MVGAHTSRNAGEFTAVDADVFHVPACRAALGLYKVYVESLCRPVRCGAGLRGIGTGGACEGLEISKGTVSSGQTLCAVNDHAVSSAVVAKRYAREGYIVSRAEGHKTLCLGGGLGIPVKGPAADGYILLAVGLHTINAWCAFLTHEHSAGVQLESGV